MRAVKCRYCGEKSPKDSMEKITKESRNKKTGEVKKANHYFHSTCLTKFQEEKEFKAKELEELNQLYNYLLRTHNLNTLSGRMMEKIQDLRNGTIKLHGKKIRRYKAGISFTDILSTYKEVHTSINWAIKSKEFETKWNEFSYCFGIMLNKVNEVAYRNEMLRKQQEEFDNSLNESQEEVLSQTIKVTKKHKTNNSDELDISEFL